MCRYCWRHTRKYALVFQCISLSKMILSLMVGQTDDLDHFRQGFLAQSCVRVCAFIMVFPLTATLPPHTHFSFHPIAVRLPDTHQHSETHTAEHEHLVLHTNDRELWDKARPIPSTAVSCRDLHTQQRPQFRDKPIPSDCTAMMWITTNNLSCLTML